MSEDRKRHCWECRRRRLVCDFTRPACNRCLSSDVDCPGYGDKPPVRLRWVAPGKVKSRSRQLTKSQSRDNSEETAVQDTRANNTVVYSELKIDAHVFLEATQYYNSCIYPTLLPMSELGPVKTLFPISPPIFQRGMAQPDHVRLVIVCMALSRQINSSENDPRSAGMVKRFLHYRGLIIRSLMEDLNLAHKRTGDYVIAGILTLLLIDAQQGPSPTWRCHLDGIRQIIRLRGGVRPLAQVKGVVPLLLCYVLVSVLGDATTSVSDLTITAFDLADVDFVIDKYGGGSFAFIWPTVLFAEITKINHLRLKAFTNTATTAEELTAQAYESLTRILNFSSEEWAESRPTAKDDWILLGNIYQTAVSLYCILSLQSVGVLPLSPFLRRNCISHAQLLQALLSKGTLLRKIRGFMLWPLVVLGIEAVNGGVATRTFVREQLVEMKQYTATYMPMAAKHMLQRLWTSGETHWDACFDQSYPFVTPLAVDVSGLR